MSGSDTPISRRRFLCTTAGAAASVGLGACGLRTSEPPQVTVWMAGAPGRPPMEQPVLDAFHKAQSRVRVHAVAHEYEDLPVKLIAALEAGAGIPDVCLLDTEYLGMVLDKGGLLDLSQPPYDAGQYEGDFVRSAWGRGVVDRRLLAVPWATYPGSMWYRADILGAAGLDTDPRRLRERIETWDDFLQLGVDLKRRGDVWMMGSPYNDVFRPALAQKGFGRVDGYRLLLEE